VAGGVAGGGVAAGGGVGLGGGVGAEGAPADSGVAVAGVVEVERVEAKRRVVEAASGRRVNIDERASAASGVVMPVTHRRVTTGSDTDGLAPTRRAVQHEGESSSNREKTCD